MSQYGEPQGQGGYGQQSQYAQGPSQYGQPPYGGQPGGSRSFGVVAAVLAVVGAALGVVSFTTVNWFTGGDDSHFSDIKHLLSSGQAKQLASGFAKIYFSWLAWVLLAAVVISAILAAIPGVGTAFRIIGVIVALGAIAATFVAIKFFNSKANESYGQYLKHARLGFYLAVAAFLVAGIGAAVGSRRRA